MPYPYWDMDTARAVWYNKGTSWVTSNHWRNKMKFDKNSMIVWDIVECTDDDDLREIAVEFVDTGNNISGKLSLIMEASATAGEIEEAVIDQYSNGHYEDLDEELAQRLINWSRQFKSVTSIGVWIADNTDTPKDQESTENAAYWFVAIQEADEMYSFGVKDIAEMLLAGIPPIKNNEEGIEYWLNTQYELHGNGNEHITTLLKQHFGIKE